MKISGLILAAGLSSRMGAFKPLMMIENKPMIVHSVESLFRGGAETVTVVLGYRADEVKDVLTRAFHRRVNMVINSDFATTDMLTSIKVGLTALPICDAFFLLPGDMPAIAKETLHLLVQKMEQKKASVVIPTIENRRKHPPLIGASCINDIRSYNGENGLRGLWHSYGNCMIGVPVQDEGCLLDADQIDDFLKLKHYLKKRCMA